MDKFRQFLQNELVRRIEENPSYSLRAFAKALDLNHATLSHLLRGRRKFTEKSMRSIALALGLGPKEIAEFSEKSENDDSFKEMAIDTFQMISDWYHDAILELTRVKGFKSTPLWIAQKLSISVNEVNSAIDRLIRLKLLKRSPNGKLVEIDGDLSTLGIDETTSALQKLQIQLMTKSIEAIQHVPKPQREQASMTMAINNKDIPEAKKMMKKFRRDLCKYLQRSGRSADSVYQLTMSLFPLSKD